MFGSTTVNEGEKEESQPRLPGGGSETSVIGP